MRIGDHVSGRYKIMDKIGSGGMANVYLAEDLILERQVAVKMMSLDFQEDEQNLRRFQREALSTTELDHPNIVNIYDVGEGSQPYIVMEYISGMDLKQYIRENYPVPYHKVIDIMGQILDGVGYAHKNNVIHRDLKPHNILIDHDGHVKLTDFGIAVALSQNSITQTNSLLGSVQYISPEQARGNIVTKQSDIYSLGIVLYELLAGTVPFDGESAVSIALKHFQAPIPDLRELDTRIPQALENVVLKATAKEPKNRYATTQEMKEDLETALSADRRKEEKFVPIDLNDEKTMVLGAAEVKAIEDASTDNKENIDETKINKEKPEKKEAKPKKKRNLLWFLLLPVIVIIIAYAYITSQPDQVVISEDLMGMTLEEASEKLAEQLLEIGEVREESSDEVDEGLVIKTNPKVGATVLEGSKVDVYISLGEEPFEIADYRGKDYEEIRAKLTELGFEVSKEDEASEEVPSGKIIEQDLVVGDKVVIGESPITFTVSTGKRIITLRDLYKYPRASVDDYVKQEGFNLTSEEESSEDVAAGLVIRQNPEPKTAMNRGDRVTVVYSTGPKEVSNITFTKDIKIPYKETLEDPEDEESKLLPNIIEIYIEDLNNDIDTVVREFLITEDDTYSLSFTVVEGEKARYRVVRNREDTIIDETVSP